MRALGAELIEYGADFQAAREEAMRLAERADCTWSRPSTATSCAASRPRRSSFSTRRPDLDVLYVPIGQGSGICGCIAARDALGLKTEIVGVQSAGAPAYALSFAAGRAVSTTSADTLADGVATRAPDEEAVAIIARRAPRASRSSADDEIAGAIRAYWTDTHNLAEGAGAAPLAAAMKERARLAGRKVGLVLSGGNIDFDLFQRWVAAAPNAAAA